MADSTSPSRGNYSIILSELNEMRTHTDVLLYTICALIILLVKSFVVRKVIKRRRRSGVRNDVV